jgi:hypothetical protein
MTEATLNDLRLKLFVNVIYRRPCSMYELLMIMVRFLKRKDRNARDLCHETTYFQRLTKLKRRKNCFMKDTF